MLGPVYPEISGEGLGETGGRGEREKDEGVSVPSSAL